MASKFTRASASAPAFKASTTQARAGKSRAKAAPQPGVIDVQATEVHEQETQSAFEKMQSTIHGAYEEFFASTGMASPRRRLIAHVLALVSACAVGYLSGWILTLLSAAVLVATGSAFLFVITVALGVILTALAGAKVGETVFNTVCGFKPNAITDAARSASTRMRGWFGAGAVAA